MAPVDECPHHNKKRHRDREVQQDGKGRRRPRDYELASEGESQQEEEPQPPCRIGDSESNNSSKAVRGSAPSLSGYPFLRRIKERSLVRPMDIDGGCQRDDNRKGQGEEELRGGRLLLVEENDLEGCYNQGERQKGEEL